MVTIIINPVSGGTSLVSAQARAELAMAQLTVRGEPGEVFVTERRGHGRELAQASVRRGDRLVIGWGGDGTINEIASALVGTSTALGIVPAGSGNGLARELHVPSVPVAAILQALAAPSRAVDAAQLGGRWFFSIAGIGFDAHVAHAFDRDTSGRRGLSSYVRITARELRRYQPARYQIDGASAVAALLVTFANSAQFGNGARIAPSARIDDGALDMVVFEERSRLTTLLALPKLFTGRVESARGVSIRKVTTAVVDSDAPMVFHVDGEPVQGGTRLEAQVFPGALRVAAGGSQESLSLAPIA
jgi:YegS/Rv2252/BmrU family lipid kinase